MLKVLKPAPVKKPVDMSEFVVSSDDTELQGDILIHAPPKAGKALPLTTKVLTPDGWRIMAELEIGSSVIGSDGFPTQVVGVYPQGVRPALKFTFSDGVETICDEEHLWTVKLKNGWTTKPANELRKFYSKAPILPRCAPVFQNKLELPIHPYILGVILGDGCLTASGVKISNSSPEIKQRVAACLDVGTVSTHSYGFGIVGSTLNETLKRFELIGCKAETKFVPSIYLRAALNDRIELMRGLMDTDGYVCAKGRTMYYTVSDQLAADVTDLARSLGAIVRQTRKETPKYTHNNEVRIGQPCNVLTINFPRDILPVTKPDKVYRYQLRSNKKGERGVSISSVVESPPQEMVCIKVEAPDGLFVIEDYVVTHNTFLAASASKFYPTDPDLSKLKKPAVLEDMLWQAFDAGATAGFKGANLRVPYVIDCIAILAQYKAMPDAIQKIAELSRGLVEKYDLKFVVADTVSQLDKFIVGYYLDLHKDNRNDFAPYKDTFARHKKYHANTSLMGLRNIWLCHSKAQMEASATTADQRNAKAASAVPGGEPITPDLTGQARTVYIGNASLELIIKSTIQPGKDKKAIKRIVYPYGTAGFEGSNRYHHKLDIEEPAHLGLIFKKITG